MKNILKYTAAAALVLSLGACQEFEDYTQTVDGASKLVYVNAGTDNLFSTKIAHRPIGSTGEFSTEFAISCNSSVHGATTVSLVYDASLVESYNAENGTAYAVLPAEYLVLENAELTLPENATVTEEMVKVSLSTEADLSLLTERYYLAPLRVESPGIDASEVMGVVYLLVETEINLIRPIDSADDMVGFPSGDANLWTADCGNYAHLFDGDGETSALFKAQGNVLTVDMKKERMVTGLYMNTSYAVNGMVIEYSLDGENWQQAGTPTAEEVVSARDNATYTYNYYTAVYDYFSARYLRLTFGISSRYYDPEVYELSVYEIESTEPTIYTMTGQNNVLTGKVVHKKGVGSTSDFSASYKAYTTIPSESGYSVTVAQDNSLIAAYNAANGTNYLALPTENLNLESATLSIAANEKASTEEVTVSLTGDLSGLTAEEGYLVPLKFEVGSGAVVSEGRGTVYVVITSEDNVIRAISSADDMVGFPVGGSSSWSISGCSTPENLVDGSNSTRVNMASSGNELVIDMTASHMVTGLHLYTYNLSNVSIAYSTDGANWKSAGTVASGENVFTGSSWRAGNYWVAFVDYIDARFLKLSFDFSGYYCRLYEIEVYEIESTEPTIYTTCGSDNTLTGTITHHNVAGTFGSVSASFNAMTTIASEAGYSVGAAVDNSLVAAYNAKNATSYATLDASFVKIEGAPCEIAAGANKSAGQISVSLQGDLSSLTNANGYLIPVKLSAPAGAIVSESRGVVYIAVAVEQSTALFMKNFAPDAIQGTQVADRSGWSLLASDAEGVHSGSYDNLFDGNTTTYIRTWGGPVSFTVDMGQTYNMTGLVITARTDNNTYAGYQPTSIMIEYSTDGAEYSELGTVMSSDGTLVASKPSSYAALYVAKEIRYLKITASYGSNMGAGEFNIYAK